MPRSIAHRIVAVALVVAAHGCNDIRAEDPEQVDRAWQARLEEAHAYAARKASGQRVPATPEATTPERSTEPVATRGATPSALLAAKPALAKQAQPRVVPRRTVRPRVRMTLEVTQAQGGRGPKVIEVGRSAAR